MISGKVLDNVSPAEIVEAAVGNELRAFLTLYGDTLLLVVRLRPGDTELAAGLGSAVIHGGTSIPVQPSGSMEFHTVVQTPTEQPLIGNRGGSAEAELARRLLDGGHFIVPLRKRTGGDALYMDRISVGRARNKDIVLRHQSVSKFHCWFEVDDTGAFHVTDAGSKNSTKVNTKVLAARERTRVEPSDIVRFGSVEAIVCAPRVLWAALGGGKRPP
jgi:FHA domain